MPKLETTTKRPGHVRGWLTGVAPLLVWATWSGAAAQPARTQVISTSDVSLGLTAGDRAPCVLWLRRGGEQINNLAPEPLPSSVEIDGVTIPVTWHHQKNQDISEQGRVAVVYESQTPHLRATWEWRARAAFGPLEHQVVIENFGSSQLWLPMIDSLRLELVLSPAMELSNFYVEKGAGAPSEQGTHLETMSEGYRWTGTSSTYAHSGPGEPREIIPAEIVFSRKPNPAGWYAGIEFSGRTRILLDRHGGHVRSVLGLNPEPGPYRTRLVPGGEFETPAVFLGAFDGDPDQAGNQLRPWVRAALGNALTWKDEHYPLVVNNSWGSGMAVDEALALRMIAQSQELGVEMFHLDAGWFRGVGDWYPDPKKFPHGLAFIADQAHKLGLRFGIWTDWTQAALDTEPGALDARDPKVRDWLVADLGPRWQPEEFKGQTVDVGVPEVRDYLRKEVKRIVDDYRLDMLEHDGYLVAQGCTRNDHPHAPPDLGAMTVKHDWGADFVLSSNQTDVSYHAARAYYDIYEHTRREHPGLLFEICNDGGRMVDFGSAAHGDYFSITDSYDPLSNRRAFYDASFLLPAAMLESYVEKWPTPTGDSFLYMLRSGMMGWLTLMLDTNVWTPEQRESAKRAIAVYKRLLRPLIRDARLYHISARPDGTHWDGIEYWDPAREQGVVFAFRGSLPGDTEHRFPLHGLKPAARYRLHFEDQSSPDRAIDGKDLTQNGLRVHLEHPLSSELVFLTPDRRTE
jgi:alpha-galactosidase